MYDAPTLDDVCLQVVDCEHKTAPAAAPGQEYGFSIGTPDIRDGRLLLNSAKQVDCATFSEWTLRASPRAEDIVLTREAPVGEAAFLDGAVPVCLGQRTVLLRPNPAKIIPRYLHYRLLAPTLQKRMHAQAEGSTVAHLNVLAIRRLALGTLPGLPEQRLIAATLGALDDKIAVNDRIVLVCDQLRTMKLGEWVRSNPLGTLERSLSSLAKFVNGRAFTKDASGAGRMVIRIAEINSGPGASTVYSDIEVPDQHLARPGEVLFAWSGSLTVARWFRPEAIINQHIFKVIPNEGVPAWLAFELVQTKLAMFRDIAADKATTMGHIQRRHLDEPVTVPTASSLARLDAELGPFWDRALAAEQESLTLAELRDTLLPRLMSGEIRVRDAEKVVEEAT
jgi:type I restriction enzyme S subunit